MTIRSFILALVLLVAIPVAAQEPEGVPRFYIDAISVEGVRWASERVIIAETRLHAGRKYTEGEIRAGAARAMRLPFVLKIEPRIEKGAQRGAYKLVLAVRETKPFFFGGTYVARDADRDVRLSTIGARYFLGRSGMAHGAVTNDRGDNLFELGYTQYDLFGSGVFVAATVEYGDDVTNLPSELYTASVAEKMSALVVAGVPLRGNHALRATFLSTPVAVLSDKVLVGLPRDENYRLERSTTTELVWIYDSTDDPLFTTRGTRSVLGAGRREIPFVLPVAFGTEPGSRDTDRQQWIIGDLRRLWSLAPRHAVSARAGDTYLRRVVGDTGRGAVTNTTFVGTSYYYSIFGPDRPSRFGDLRLETGLVYQQSRAKFGNIQASTTRQTFVRAGLLFRNEWGVVRFLFDVEPGRE